MENLLLNCTSLFYPISLLRLIKVVPGILLFPSAAMRFLISQNAQQHFITKVAIILGLTLDSTQALSNSTANSTAVSKASNAVEAMMGFYNHTTGLWGDSLSPWWASGNALQSLLDYVSKTGSTQYLSVATNTIAIQRAPVPWWPEGGGDFRADSTDDTGWWALANLKMYNLTGDETYLNIAKEDEAYMWSYRDNGTCSEGILWDIPSKSYVNAISNELYLTLVASLHNNIPGDNYYLNKALEHWAWFKSSGMINSEHLVNDGLTETNSTCTNNGATTWTYNQGVILGGLTELYKATGNDSLITTARQIADAVIASSLLSPNGILTEPCESDPDTCEPNAPNFKGIFVRYLSELNSATSDRPYSTYLNTQATSAYENDRNNSNYYGLSWAGPYQDVEIGSQASAVSLLTAVL